MKVVGEFERHTIQLLSHQGECLCRLAYRHPHDSGDHGVSHNCCSMMFRTVDGMGALKNGSCGQPHYFSSVRVFEAWSIRKVAPQTTSKYKPPSRVFSFSLTSFSSSIRSPSDQPSLVVDASRSPREGAICADARNLQCFQA